MSWRSLLASLGLIFAIACSASGPAHAVQADEVLSDPALEARARDISAGLRCLVCQNQSIDDSDAPLARDLRILVRERLQAGDSDRQVLDFLVARYGEFVLLKPRLSWRTALLWIAPILILLGGLVAIAAALRRRRTTPAAAAPLAREEELRVKEILRQD
jgi:cytochrome c-type biogenesis protein CcmH